MYLYGEGPLQYYFDNPLHNIRAKALYLKNSGKEVPASPNEVVEINRRPGLCPLIQITPEVSLYIFYLLNLWFTLIYIHNYFYLLNF
jgi:hypothetical protein